MNYKDIIKNRQARLKILRIMGFVPDKLMVQLQYKIKTGRRLSLKEPKRFTEKIQWYKLYYRDPIMKQCADKYEVRNFIKQYGYESILNELYGVYDSPEEIKFENLPSSFVLKDTLGGGGNAVIVVKDKKKEDWDTLKATMWGWIHMPIDGKHPGREWVYEKKKHRIIVEKYIEPEDGRTELTDYKFFCFAGKCHYMYVINGREIGGKAHLGIFDSNFNKIDACREDELLLETIIEKPKKFKEMRDIAERLSETFPEVRVDLYNENGKIVFGEMTFFDGSGYMNFNPDDFDFVMGERFELRR